MPKYEKLKQIIKDHIRDGTWKSGEKLPTEQVLCERFDVSKITIKKAKDDLLAEGVLENLPGRKGTFISQTMRVLSTGLIGVAFDDVVDPHYATILKGIEDKLWENKFHTILCNAYHDVEKIEAYFHSLVQRHVEGVIFTPVKGHEYIENNRRIIQMLTENHVPCVLVDRYIPGLFLNRVVSDNLQRSKEVTKLLLEKGHQRILVMTGIECSSIHERLQGHVEALQEAGVESDPQLIIRADELQLLAQNHQQTQELERIRGLIEHGGNFTACYAMSPTLLQAAIQAFFLNGDNARKPIAIATYDQTVKDIVRITDSATVISQPSYRMGREAARLIIEMINNPDLPGIQITLQSEISEEIVQ
jgi:DNA-binding LacI/PurR family transcriptional regulator